MRDFVQRRLPLVSYLTLVAFLLAHLINLMAAQALTPGIALSGAQAGVTPAEEKADPRRLVADILGSRLFAMPQPAIMRALDAGGPVLGKPLEATKKVRLIGTVVGDGLIPLAVIEDLSTKSQAFYKLHDRIPNLGEITEIRKDGVMIQDGDQRELLELEISKPGRLEGPGQATTAALSPAGAHRTLDKREVAHHVADLPRLLSEARALPVYENGKITGWRLESLAPRSFYEQIGLRSGTSCCASTKWRSATRA